MANQMSGTFLIDNDSNTVSNVFSGTTTNPASPPAWNWLVIGGITQATNFNNSPQPPAFVDQPWLLVNADPMIPTQDNVYAAYDDFTNGNDCLNDDCNIRVSVSYGVNPPNFTVDNQPGTATGSINPGHRLAVDPRSGSVYSLFQRNIGPRGRRFQKHQLYAQPLHRRRSDVDPEWNRRWDYRRQRR
jgi:hypothetical protein